eukprot:12665100-Alexandrium_andersonii.AAC.1
MDVAPDESASQCGVPSSGTPAHGVTRSIGKAKAKGGAKAKAKPTVAKAGQMACEMCEEISDIIDFPPNQVKCYDCKSDWDSLFKMCKRQSQMAWYTELQASPLPKKRKVWKSFKTKFRAVACPRAKKAFSLLNMIESFKVTSATDTIQGGKMMWKDEAIEHWKSIPGGKHTESEATEMWEQLLVDPDALLGWDGPAKAPRSAW